MYDYNFNDPNTTNYMHQKVEQFTLEKGYSVEHVMAVETDDLIIEASSNSNYKVIAGKALKDNNIFFLDYSIENPVNNVTSGSVITVYDDFEPFVSMDKGLFPPHASTFEREFEEEVYDRKELMSSKRLMDYKLHVFNDPEGPADKHYLFTKDKLSSYEEGFPIRGSFSTLLDRGFVSIFFKKLRIQSQINKNYEPFLPY